MFKITKQDLRPLVQPQTVKKASTAHIFQRTWNEGVEILEVVIINCNVLH